MHMGANAGGYHALLLQQAEVMEQVLLTSSATPKPPPGQAAKLGLKCSQLLGVRGGAPVVQRLAWLPLVGVELRPCAHIAVAAAWAHLMPECVA